MGTALPLGNGVGHARVISGEPAGQRLTRSLPCGLLAPDPPADVSCFVRNHFVFAGQKFSASHVEIRLDRKQVRWLIWQLLSRSCLFHDTNSTVDADIRPPLLVFIVQLILPGLADLPWLVHRSCFLPLHSFSPALRWHPPSSSFSPLEFILVRHSVTPRLHFARAALNSNQSCHQTRSARGDIIRRHKATESDRTPQKATERDRALGVAGTSNAAVYAQSRFSSRPEFQTPGPAAEPPTPTLCTGQTKHSGRKPDYCLALSIISRRGIVLFSFNSPALFVPANWEYQSR